MWAENTYPFSLGLQHREISVTRVELSIEMNSPLQWNNIKANIKFALLVAQRHDITKTF